MRMDATQKREVDAALQDYWTSRDSAAVRQVQRGSEDIGGRSGATSGGHLDQVAAMLARVCIKAGAPANQVWYKAPKGDPLRKGNQTRSVTLPGYYRPTKQWDLVVHHNREPIVVVELKSQNGPSYGNNANNRVEEAIGSAVDFARARAAGLIPGNPWLGYAFVIEDDLRSRKDESGRDSSCLTKDPLFAGWSYIARIRLLGQRLVQEGHYDAAWAVATSRPYCPGVKKPKNCPQLKLKTAEHVHKFAWCELDEENLSYSMFIDGLIGQIRRYYSR